MRIGSIKSFTIDGLKKIMTQEGFVIFVTHVQMPKPPRLFVVARKKK